LLVLELVTMLSLGIPESLLSPQSYRLGTRSAGLPNDCGRISNSASQPPI
jgi:hypothetical protein